MDLTDTQMELCFNAWTLARAGHGMVITDDAYPDAHELAERGWLERRFQPDGELAWFWSPAGDQALELSSLLNDYQGAN